MYNYHDCKVLTCTLCKYTTPMIVMVPPNPVVVIWVYIYLCSWHRHRSRVASMQYHCCVVDWQCTARALTLPRTRLDPQLGPSQYMPTGSIPPTPRWTPMLPWSTKSNGGTGLMAGAQSTVGIQGPETVHEASRAIRLTHLLSCTGPRSSWHVQAPPYVATHHALVHTQSI